MTDETGPIPEGVTQGPLPVYQGEPPAKLKLLAEDNLLSLSEDYVFYTPAILWSAVPTGPNLFASFVAEFGLSIEQFQLDFQRAIFHDVLVGGNILLAVQKEHWSPFRGYLGTAAFKVGNRVARIRLQDIGIPDPIQQERTPLSQQQEVPVVALAMESDRGSLYYRRIWSNGQIVGVYCVSDPRHVFSDTKAFAAAFNAEATNPYREANDAREDRTTGGE